MTTADPARMDVRRSLPGYWRVVWAVLVGYVTAALLLVLAGLALWLAGLLGTAGTSGADPSGVLGSPFYRDGWWSVVANATATAVAILLAVVCIARAVEWWTPASVSRSWVAGAVLLTGYVPIASLPGPFPGNGIVALLATALVVQRVALDRPPAPSLLSRRQGRVVAGAGAVAAVVALGTTGAYALTHPLWFGSAVGGEPRAGDPEGVLALERRGGGAAYTFSLRNVGFADATLTGVEASTEILRLAGFRVDGEPPVRAVPEALGGSARIPGRETRYVTIVFERSACRPGSVPREAVAEVTVRYRVLGTEQRQVVPLVPAAAVTCH